jgi:Transposase DDE domain
VPRKLSQRTWIPKDLVGQGRKTVWTYGRRLCLCQVGDVTVVLSKKGRHVGPKHPKMLVTNLPEWTPRHVVSIYQKRWAIERVNWERKSGLGLGHHQVSGDEKRRTNSMGIAVLASLFLLRVCHHEITPGQSWSIFQLQQAFQLRAMTNQVEHNVKVKMAKVRKVA